MIELLLSIRDALRNAAGLAYIADRDIFITFDVTFLPFDAGFPAIGIKDGNVDFALEEGRAWEKTINIDLIVYQLLMPGDISLLGQAVPRVRGVLEIARDVHSVLFDNRFAIVGLESAVPLNERSVESLEGTDVALLKKRITYQYRQLGENPQ